MDKEIELLFELDYGLHQAYRIELKNGLIHYEDDADTDYMPMTGIWFECGQRNGVYKPDLKQLDNLEKFVFSNIINWRCYYPNMACDAYQKWKLSIIIDGIEILTSGYGHKPDDFEDFTNLINSIFPEEKNINGNWIGGLDKECD